MVPEQSVSSIAVDLSQLHRRTLTSFYSNLVTRPTGRAIRMGVESQLAEMEGDRRICLSILDFTQVRVLDYSCADEIVAKLLLRYAAPDRPADAYFLARGLHEHHRDAVEAVLEHHDLLLVAQDVSGEAHLLGPSNPLERACWDALTRRGRASPRELAAAAGLPYDTVSPAVQALVERRVALTLLGDVVCSLTSFCGE